MKYLQSIIFGFISGISEFLPISSDAHQQILGSLFGFVTIDPMRKLFIHIAILLSVYSATSKARSRITAAQQKLSKRSSLTNVQSKVITEYRFLRSATIPFLIAFFLLRYIFPAQNSILLISLTLMLNGLIIFLPERMLQGNKNASVMSKTDGGLIGIAGALSVFPGISRIGCTLSVSAMRGAERKQSVNWVLLLSIPAIWSWIIIDTFAVFSSTGFAFWDNFLANALSAFFAFIGSRAGIRILRKQISAHGFTGYAYYCWGAALFSLILFLSVA